MLKEQDTFDRIHKKIELALPLGKESSDQVDKGRERN